MNKDEAYEKWASFDVSRKGVLQESAFKAGWDVAIEKAKHTVKMSYIIDESEDIKEVILENL
jgi:hypothetical protein